MTSTVTQAFLRLHQLSPSEAMDFVCTLPLDCPETWAHSPGGGRRDLPLACHLMYTGIPEMMDHVVAKASTLGEQTVAGCARALLETAPLEWLEKRAEALWTIWQGKHRTDFQSFRTSVAELMRGASTRTAAETWRAVAVLQARLLPPDQPLPKGLTGNANVLVQKWTSAAILEAPGAHFLLESWVPTLPAAYLTVLIEQAVEWGAVGPLVAGLKRHPDNSAAWRRSLCKFLVESLKAHVWVPTLEIVDPLDGRGQRGNEVQVGVWWRLLNTGASRQDLRLAAHEALGLDGASGDMSNANEKRKAVALMAPFAHLLGDDWLACVQGCVPAAGEQEMAALIYGQDRGYAQARVDQAGALDPASLTRALTHQLAKWTPAHHLDHEHMGALMERGWIEPGMPMPRLKDERHQQRFAQVWTSLCLSLVTREALVRPVAPRPRM